MSTTAAPPPQALRRGLGEAFTLGENRMAVLSVQDPFPPSPQTQPAAGNRLISVKYEAVSQSAGAQSLGDLPAIELQDAAGANYVSEHSRLSLTAGRTPGQLLPGKRMESSVLFEVPDGASGLRAAFRTAGTLAALVTLD